ncbi:MAG: hypothetical protein QNJ72_41625 [Pleurocapsa sp. MO_226.B13]|nr:hypothetical protein [Pleurocapsa sp. MO_226.B13]
MTKQFKIQSILLPESNERRQRLISLTARLVAKILDQETKPTAHSGGSANGE